MFNNNLQKEIISLEQELLNLKNIQGQIDNIESYHIVVNNPSSKVKIVYEDGDNDILTRRYIIGFTWPTVLLTTPHNNEQYLLCDNTGIPVQAVLLVSTRPFKSVINM